MTVQFKVEWNGYDAGGVYTLSAPEEARLIAAGIAFNYTGPITSPGVVTVGDDGILRDPKGQAITSGVSSTDTVARASAAAAQSTADAAASALTAHNAAADPHPGYQTQAESDARYVRTVNGTAPDGSGNVAVAGGGGSALPTAIAPVTAIPLDGNKVFNADTVMSATALTIAAGQVEGGSCSLVIKGDGSSTWGGITGASKASGSATFSNTLNAVNHVLVWVDRGRVRYTISQSDPIEIATTPVAPTNTVPTIVTATAGSALVFTGGSASGSPTPTTVYSWRTSGGALVQDNITSGSYTPPAAGSFILRMISTNTQGTDTDDVSVTVSAAATAPAAPTLSGATSITATGLTYTWADGSNGGSAITGRNADISFDGGTTWAALPTPAVGANNITYTSSGSARTAQIRGRATNSVGPGAYGTLASIAVPAASLAALPAQVTTSAAFDLAASGTPAATMDGSGVVTAPATNQTRKTASYAGDFDVAVRMATDSEDGNGVAINLLDGSTVIAAIQFIAWLNQIKQSTPSSSVGVITTATTNANVIMRAIRTGSTIKLWGSADAGANYSQVGADVTSTAALSFVIGTGAGYSAPVTYRIYAS
jgi:hypothetical protein